jgi:mannose-6-phosphate isomerase-like protein (cupin superfamily)
MSELCKAFLLSEARRAPLAEGRISARIWQRESAELGYYHPPGVDPQNPDDRDELYFVCAGRRALICNGERTPITTGDALFGAAGADHRFEEISDDFAIRVVFYGPQGGERTA